MPRKPRRQLQACPRCTWPIDVPGVQDPSICYRCEAKALGKRVLPPAVARAVAQHDARALRGSQERVQAERTAARRDQVAEHVQWLRGQVKWKDQSSRRHEEEAKAAATPESAAVGWTRCAQAALEAALACDLLAAKGEPKDRAHSLRCAQGRRRRAAHALEQALQVGAQAVAAAKPLVLQGGGEVTTGARPQLQVVRPD